MINEITEIGFQDGATLSSATVTLADMGERTITADIKVSGNDLSVDDMELEFRGERFVPIARDPNATKTNERVQSVVSVTFLSYAISQLKRFWFFKKPEQGTNIFVDQYVVPIGLTFTDFVSYLGAELSYYYGSEITCSYDPNLDLTNLTEAKYLDINYTTLWDVLTLAYEAYGVRWKIVRTNDTYNIFFTSASTEISHVFKYGYDGGLTHIERQAQSEDLHNKIFGRGTDRNLPFYYFKRVREGDTTGYVSDPDCLYELKHVNFEEMRGIAFRWYVRGWMQNSHHDTTWENNLDPDYTTAYSYPTYTTSDIPSSPQWLHDLCLEAFNKGKNSVHETQFNPIEYVKDDVSIERYGELWGKAETDESIYPTMQGVTVSGLGRIDQIIDYEDPTGVDNIDVAAAEESQVIQYPDAVEFYQGMSNSAWPMAFAPEVIPAPDPDNPSYYIHTPSPEWVGYQTHHEGATTHESWVKVTMELDPEKMQINAWSPVSIPEGLSGYVEFDKTAESVLQFTKIETTLLSEGQVKNKYIDVSAEWIAQGYSLELVGEPYFYAKDANGNYITEDDEKVKNPTLTSGNWILEFHVGAKMVTRKGYDGYTPSRWPEIPACSIKIHNINVQTYRSSATPYRTFYVWAKNIWQTTKSQSETAAEYAARVWGPILGNKGQEAKVVFSSGQLATSSDWDFVISKVEYDTSKTLNGVQSEWKFLLLKSEAEYQADGKFIPRQGTAPVSGDYFFFVDNGIVMPQQFVMAAEARLDEYKLEVLSEQKDILPSWSINFDKIRIATLASGEQTSLYSQLEAGKQLKFQDPRLTDNNILTKYIESLTISWNEGESMLPNVEVTLSDVLRVYHSPIQTLSAQVRTIQMESVTEPEAEDVSRKVAARDSIPSTGAAKAKGSAPLQLASTLQSPNYSSGMLDGTGWSIYRNNDGDYTLEIDVLKARRGIVATNVTVDEWLHEGGVRIMSAANMRINRVDVSTDYYTCYFDNQNGSLFNLFHENDIALCNKSEVGDGSTKYYRYVVAEVSGSYVRLSRASGAHDGDGIPSAGDEIIQYGNTTDANRQHAIVIDAKSGHERMLFNLSSVSATGVVYYYVGAAEDTTGVERRRWYVGDTNGYIEYTWNPNANSGQGGYVLAIGGDVYIGSGQVSIESLNYLAAALGDDQSQGLVLSNQIAVYNGNNIMGGLSGVYDSSLAGGGIAAWFGGAKTDTGEGFAKVAFRFDGSGYVAAKHISWDAAGNCTIDGTVQLASGGTVGDMLTLVQGALQKTQVASKGSHSLPVYFDEDGDAQEIDSLEVDGGVAGGGLANLGMGGEGGIGTVTAVQIGTATPILPVNGIVTLPAYPSLAGYATESWVTQNFAGKGYETRVQTIEGLIPITATSSNKLADVNFVNSSINTATASYKGNYNVVSDLSLGYDATTSAIETALNGVTMSPAPDKNDYCFVTRPTSTSTPTEIKEVLRYKYDSDNSTWSYEYTINNSGFTAAQWAAVNSGITSALVGDIGTLKGFFNMSTGVANNADKLDGRDSSYFATAADYLPLSGGTMANTNLVTNLNADLLDGKHSSDFVASLATSNDYLTWTKTGGSANNITIPYATKALKDNNGSQIDTTYLKLANAGLGFDGTSLTLKNGSSTLATQSLASISSDFTLGNIPDRQTAQDANPALKITIAGQVRSIARGSNIDINARNLIGFHTPLTDQVFRYRTTAGTANIGNGQAHIDSIKGNSLVWNQLVQNGDFSNGTTGWSGDNCTFSVDNGIAKMTGNARNAKVRYSVSTLAHTFLTPSHKYIYSAYIKTTSNKIIFGVTNNSGSSRYNTRASGTGSWEKLIFICTAESATILANYYSIVIFDERTSNWDEVQIKDVHVHDLTLMFGSAIDGMTNAQIRAMFEALYPEAYYPYNAGTLISFGADDTLYETVGFNQWDEEWELGNISYVNGNNVADGARIRSKNFIPVYGNTTYYFHNGANAEMRALAYDASYNYLGAYLNNSWVVNGGGTSDVTNKAITTPVGCAFLKFSPVGAYGTTYNHDICINLSWSGNRNGQYELYWKETKHIPITQLKGRLNGTGDIVLVYPDGMRRAGSAFDEIVKEGDVWVGYKRTGSVDLGTLDWIYYQSQFLNQTAVSNMRSRPSTSTALGYNIICAKYVSSSATLYVGIANKEIGATNGTVDNIRIADSAYTDAAAFKTAMNGVYIHYELATYERYVLVDDLGNPIDLDMDYRVDDQGTECWPQVSTTMAPPYIDVTYKLNAVDDVRGLPSTYVRKDYLKGRGSEVRPIYFDEYGEPKNIQGLSVPESIETTMGGMAAGGIANLGMGAVGSGTLTQIQVNGTGITDVGGVVNILAAEGSTNGAFSLAGQSIAIHGLGSLAYKSSLAFSELTGKPTTLNGYGITDAYISSGTITLGSNTITPLLASLKGAANGVAELDANGLVPSSQLPSYVDDVLEYASKSAFPSSGETGKIYVALDTNLTWRWSGSAYVEISPSLALGETSSTAYRGDRGATAYAHATDANRLTTAQSSSFYKFATTAQGHIASVTAVSASDLTTLIGNTTYAPYNADGYLPLTGGTIYNSQSSYPLVIKGSSAASGIIFDDDSNNTLGRIYADTDHDISWYNGTSSYTMYHSGNANLSTVNWNCNNLYANGDVGIGTNNPQYKLDVAGLIGCTGVQGSYLTDNTEDFYVGDYYHAFGSGDGLALYAYGTKPVGIWSASYGQIAEFQSRTALASAESDVLRLASSGNLGCYTGYYMGSTKKAEFGYYTGNTNGVYILNNTSNQELRLTDGGLLHYTGSNYLAENTPHYFRDPTASGWRGGMYWGSYGNESLSFIVKNAASRFQFVGDSDIASWSNNTWQNVTPWFTIKADGVETSGNVTAAGGIAAGGIANLSIN